MEKWILRRHIWLRLLNSLPFIFLSATACLLCANVAFVFMTKYAFGVGFDWLHFAVGVFSLLFAVLFAFICFLIVQDGFSQVAFTSQGIEQRQYGKRLCFIPWDELAETGIALEKWTVRGGPYRCIYFADRHLDEYERVAIDEILDQTKKGKGGKLIKVACKGIQNEDVLKSICPIPIPMTQKPQNIKLNLLSYRRDRNTDGSWKNAETDILPDAGKMMDSFRLLQKEKNKRHRH